MTGGTSSGEFAWRKTYVYNNYISSYKKMQSRKD